MTERILKLYRVELAPGQRRSYDTFTEAIVVAYDEADAENLCRDEFGPVHGQSHDMDDYADLPPEKRLVVKPLKRERTVLMVNLNPG